MEKSKSNAHYSVLLEEAIDALHIKPSGIYVDMTLGRGGHAAEILRRLDEHGRLIGIDQDAEAIEFCKERFKNDQRVTLVESNFSNLEEILHGLKIDCVDGILLDLGVSSPQLDNADRGFSYVSDGPLDMRMDQSQQLTAKTIVNTFTFEQLRLMFRSFGEVRNPSWVANEIIRSRNLNPIETTGQLVEIIHRALPVKERFKKNSHPEKVYFQALRIAVNDELRSLETAIKASTSCLNVGGYLAIITFHSLEDKLVAQAFKRLTENTLPKEIPINDVWRDFEMVRPLGIKPSQKEASENSRSKSAKLRVLKKIH